MKTFLTISALTALLLFTGCGGEPTVDSTDTQTLEDPSATGTDSANGANGMGDDGLDQSGADASELTLSAMENKLTTITFDFGKYEIKAKMEPALKGNADLVKTAASAYAIKLEGNCDEWGSDEYNYALGLKRAKAAKDAMIAEGVDKSRITMVSFGESNPTCTEQTQACWAENRRVDFKLLP